MHFELLGSIKQVETFAVGSGIREMARLKRRYEFGKWRKRKGIAPVKLKDGSHYYAELHWFEASGIGRKEMKINRLIESL